MDYVRAGYAKAQAGLFSKVAKVSAGVSQAVKVQQKYESVFTIEDDVEEVAATDLSMCARPPSPSLAAPATPYLRIGFIGWSTCRHSDA